MKKSYFYITTIAAAFLVLFILYIFIGSVAVFEKANSTYVIVRNKILRQDQIDTFTNPSIIKFSRIRGDLVAPGPVEADCQNMLSQYINSSKDYNDCEIKVCKVGHNEEECPDGYSPTGCSIVELECHYDTVLDTSDWRVYRDEDLGFSFKYSSAWGAVGIFSSNRDKVATPPCDDETLLFPFGNTYSWILYDKSLLLGNINKLSVEINVIDLNNEENPQILCNEDENGITTTLKLSDINIEPEDGEQQFINQAGINFTVDPNIKRGRYNEVLGPLYKAKVDNKLFWITGTYNDSSDTEEKINQAFTDLENLVKSFEIISPLVGEERCATYTRDNRETEYCALCGDGICEPYEGCNSSHISCTNNPQGGSPDCIATSDCGGLYCLEDCK